MFNPKRGIRNSKQWAENSSESEQRVGNSLNYFKRFLLVILEI
jgi:hypothetical protein